MSSNKSIWCAVAIAIVLLVIEIRQDAKQEAVLERCLSNAPAAVDESTKVSAVQLMTGKRIRAREIVADMRAWFEKLERPAYSITDSMMVRQQCFDDGVIAASEFVRRYTNDEDLAYVMLEACYAKHVKSKESDRQTPEIRRFFLAPRN